MQLFQWVSVTLVAHTAVAEAKKPKCDKEFSNRVIFTPPEGSRALYPRVAELSDGTILATVSWKDPNAALAYFPIYESKDHGWTWTHISNVTDDVNGLGMWAQPALYQLHEPFGKFPEGTVLASGNSAGNTSTNIDLYASLDLGHSWEFVSNVARGGRPNTTNGADPIWEPWIMPYNGEMGVFYSDQRDPAHGQKLCHQESTDLLNWGEVVNDVASLNYTNRPGMTVIDHIESSGKWIFVYEFPERAGDLSYFQNTYPIYYKLGNNPFDFRYSDGFPLIANESTGNGSPYVVYTSAGGPNGTLIVSDGDTQSVFTNNYVGRVDKWAMKQQPGRAAYSRSLLIPKSNPDRLYVFSASTFDDDPEGGQVPFSVTALSVTKLLADGYTLDDF
ncbi:hypothetical protein NLU13_5081 [Sarocladium strictum]|uniref:Uncharacterized protein n=1 Tax=Sarocladium strictum TaxID=5046 RepID=A0AA39GK39_SARSR|nr:hypothetical protein NLU13_5081 [Sarocladium strictum]